MTRAGANSPAAVIGAIVGAAAEELPPTVVLACPKCGHTSFDSDEPATVTYRGVRVELHPEDGARVPEYDQADFTASDGEFVDDLGCRGCGVRLSANDLTADGPIDPNWTRPAVTR